MSLTLALAGDVMLGRLVDQVMAREGPAAPWRDMARLRGDADLFVYNLENAVCSQRPKWEPDLKTFHFRLDPTHRETLKDSGVDAVGLANNHVLDYGTEGLLETLRHLDELGIPHAGAGRDLAEARAPAMLEAKGRRVALVCAADHERAWAAGPETPGIFLFDPYTCEGLESVASAVEAARDGGADLVVVGLHWGPNMRRRATNEFEWFARCIVERGADLVWGTSAHLTQGIEFHERGVILYDTGDFLDDYAVDPRLRNDLSFLFRVTFEEDQTAPRVDLVPTRIERMRVRPATPDEAQLVVTVEEELCAVYGTRLVREGDVWHARPV